MSSKKQIKAKGIQKHRPCKDYFVCTFCLTAAGVSHYCPSLRRLAPLHLQIFFRVMNAFDPVNKVFDCNESMWSELAQEIMKTSKHIQDTFTTRTHKQQLNPAVMPKYQRRLPAYSRP